MYPIIFVKQELMKKYDVLNRFTNIKKYGSNTYYDDGTKLKSNSYHLDVGLEPNENKIDILNEIFTLRNKTDSNEEKELNQSLMMLHLDTALDDIHYIGKTFVLDYVDKLFEHGMELQWTMLLNHHHYYHNDKYTDEFKKEFNDKLLKHCIGHDPNKEAFINKYSGTSAYPPLYALNKTLEAFHDGYYTIDINSIYRDFVNYIKIGCDPNYVHCEYYDVKGFPIGLSKHINNEYTYTEIDVSGADLNVVIKPSDCCRGTDTTGNPRERKIINKNKNLSLIKLIQFIVSEYAKLNYVIDKSELSYLIINN